MFKTAKELKAFVTWATKNHVKRVKVGEIEVEISDLAFIPELNPPKPSKVSKKVENITYDDVATIPAAEKEDEDLYYSSN